MKKTVFIAAIVIIFVMALVDLGQTEGRSQGQCSYHGGFDTATGKCKDGSSPGAVGPSSEKPDSAEKEKAKACKAATSKYNSLANSATWKKIQADDYNSSACFKKWDEAYAPKIAACKTDSCRNGYQSTINKKYEACEVKELWALDWRNKVETAQQAKDTTCK